MGGGEKHSEMGEYFVSRRPLVLFPEISRKNACVEHKLVVVVHNFLGQLGCGSGVGICYAVIPNSDWIANDKRFRKAYTPTDPTKVVWCQIDDAVAYADTGSTP